MKVLTIKEPFATLIKNRVKYIETRSWKTNYRGELYIQAGVAKIRKEVKEREGLSELYNEDELNYGHIICSWKICLGFRRCRTYYSNKSKRTVRYLELQITVIISTLF